MGFASTLLVLSVIVCVALADGLVNSKVERRIDLTTQIARHKISITVQNKGTSAATTYELALHESQAPNLSFIKATDDNNAVLKVSAGKKTTASPDSYTSFQVTFDKPLEAGKSSTITINLALVHTQKPFPTHISQTSSQLVLYHDNHFFFSPYKTSSQKTIIKLASNNVEDYSENKPTRLSGDTLTYGSYEDIPAHSYSELKVHFQNNSPFITVSKLTREIEISHWGNLAVEEYFDIRHDGAKLKGSFSRFDFQRNPSASPSAVLQIVDVLPNGASDVYYRDDIGNISTSTFRPSARGLEFYIIPRFPLFGGWKNSFYIGYNLPLDEHLNHVVSDSSHLVLNTTFGVDIDAVVVEQLVVRIILPEGAKDANVVLPFSVDTQSTAKHYTYLDTIGRTVLVIEKNNVVKDHNQYFQVNYTYSSLSMLQEPLLVAGAFFAFFLAVIFYVRFEITIRPSRQPVHDTKNAKAVQLFKDSIAKFNKEYQNLLSAYKTISTPISFKEERGRLVQLYITKPLTDASNVASSLVKSSAQLAEKLQDIVNYENDRLHARFELQDLEMEFKAGGSKGKVKYDKEREEVQRRYDEATDGVESLVGELVNYL